MSLRDFGPNELMFLIMATRWTILLALIAFAGGGVIGLVVAALRVAPIPPLRWRYWRRPSAILPMPTRSPPLRSQTRMRCLTTRRRQPG